MVVPNHSWASRFFIRICGKTHDFLLKLKVLQPISVPGVSKSLDSKIDKVGYYIKGFEAPLVDVNRDANNG